MKSRRVRAVAVLHVPDSTLGAVRMGYGRLRDVMASRGDTLDILTPNQFPAICRVHGRWIVLLYPFAVAWRLWRVRGQYDVVLFHSYAGWVAHLLGVAPPAVTAFHGVEPLHFREADAAKRAQGTRLSLRFRLVHGWLMERMLRLSCRRSVRVTCLNIEEQAFLRFSGWATEEQLVLLRHGIPDVFFSVSRLHPVRARRLLFVSQWQPHKGIVTLVEAFTRARQSVPDLELWCVGTRATDAVVLGAFPPECRGAVVHRPEVTQQELAAIARDADVFVHLAPLEAYGRAIAEAMASGMPIICTRVGVARELLRDGESVWFVPNDDATAVAAAIRRLAGDAGLRERLGRAAHEAARSLRAAERDAVVADLLTHVAGLAA